MQWTRMVAGRSLALVAPLAVALALLVVMPGGTAETVAAVATCVLAAAGAVLLVLRDEGLRTAAARSERRLRAVVEELPVATYAARFAYSRPVFISPQIERLFEMTADQALAVGDFWAQRLHPFDREPVLRHWRSWCADPARKPFRRSYRLLVASGRVVWVDDVTVLLPSEPHEPPTFQRHLFDVTAQRELEEELRDARARAHRVGVAVERREVEQAGAPANQRSRDEPMVRCLGCGARYPRPLAHLSLGPTSCPRCEYVGWATADY